MCLPHDTFRMPGAKELDNMSVQDRINEIATALTPQERAALEATLLLTSGATLETTSFHEWMHWWAMCGFTYQGWLDKLITWKFHKGQSSFAIRFFEEALATGRLSYAFNSPVKHVRDTGSKVEVTTRDGQQFNAARVISAMPLNVLSEVTFDPPLIDGKHKAMSLGNINQTVKVHAEVSDKDLRSWTGITYPHNEQIYAIADGTTPAGNTHIVSFGALQNHMHPEEDIERTKRAITNLFSPKNNKVVPEIERLVFHNWSKDEFAKGAWFFSAPGLLSNHLDDMRARHGNVLFANSDWALGWRSFIDGAIEEGTRAALEVRQELGGLTFNKSSS
jgi:monoamine oxidase